MTSAFDQAIDRPAASVRRDQTVGWLQDQRWDRIFIVGGAILVPVPILLYYALRSAGVAVGACEDVVTAVVMILVGGPHVFATYTRTLLNPRFRREDRALFIGAFVVASIVIGSVVASAFFDVQILGRPPIQFVLTFFFFWAGIHVLHQNSYCAACYEIKTGQESDRRRRWWNSVDYFAMFGCLFPIAFFRMSMVNPADLSGATANPDALATKIVIALSGSTEFADEYVFRIGRVAPILPEFVRADAFWITIAAVFAVIMTLFTVRWYREWRAGRLHWPRFSLVALTIGIGFLVPVFPNLDTSFQGINAWHSFQYLGLVWLWNRRAYERGEIDSPFVKRFSGPGQHWRYYMIALAGTLLLLGVVFLGAMAIQYGSGGKFLLFGNHSSIAAADPAVGAPLYRPGSLLLAYYMIGFSLLLVHYLHDGFFFFRTRYLVDRKR